MQSRAGWTYRAVRDDHDVDVDAMVRALPSGAKVKGVFIEFVLDQLKRAGGSRERVTARAGLEPRRYLPFLDFPYEDYIRLGAAVAREVFPREPTSRGLRMLGRGQYPMFENTVPGRVTFGIFGRDAERLIPIGPKGWQMSLNFGRVESESLGRHHARYHFVDMPAMLDTMSLGVVEGALEVCGVVGKVAIAQQDAGNASYDITWG